MLRMVWHTYHSYTTVLAFQYLVNISGLSPLSPPQLDSFMQLVVKGCGGNIGHNGAVQNHPSRGPN